jgi:signal transduction histidine kinase
LPLSISGHFISDWVTVSPSSLTKEYRPGEPSAFGATQHVFDHGIIEVLDISDTNEYPFLAGSDFLQQHNVKSYIGMRMRLGAENVGVIYANFGEVRRLDKEDKNALKGIADLAAGVIHSSLILEENQKFSEDLKKLVGLGDEPSNVFDFDIEVSLGYITRGINELIPSDECAIWLLDPPDSNILKPLPTGKKYAEQVKSMTLRIGEGIVGKVAQERQSYISQNVAADTQSKHVPGTQEDEEQSMIAVPMLFESSLLGVISVSRYGLGKFDERRDLSLMQLIGGRAAAFVKIGLLLTELRSAEEELTKEVEDSFTDRGERIAGHVFYDTVAHDIGSMLQIITGLLAGLETNLKLIKSLPPKSREHFDKTLRRVEDSQNVIVEFLELSRSQTTRAERKDINGLIQRACTLIQPRLQDKGIVLETNLVREKVITSVNTFQIVEVIINLLTNAIKAMESVPENRRTLLVRSTTTEDEKWVEIQIVDRGIGIKRENEPKIFTTRYSYWPQREGAKGTGLGLNICKRIIEEHGGHISFYSTYGKGTTFVITLPVLKRGDE